MKDLEDQRLAATRESTYEPPQAVRLSDARSAHGACNSGSHDISCNIGGHATATCKTGNAPVNCMQGDSPLF
jgi:hypothetical protein